jgi:hypothetical protein
MVAKAERPLVPMGNFVVKHEGGRVLVLMGDDGMRLDFTAEDARTFARLVLSAADKAEPGDGT